MIKLRKWLPILLAHSEDVVAEEFAITYAASWLSRVKQDLTLPPVGPSRQHRYSLIVRLSCHILLMYLRCWDDVVAVAHALVRAVFSNSFASMSTEFLTSKLPNPAHLGRRAVVFDMAVALVHRQQNLDLRLSGGRLRLCSWRGRGGADFMLCKHNV